MSAVVLGALFVITTLGWTWHFGLDPALLPPPESAELSAELKPLRVVPNDVLISVSNASSHRWILGPGFDAAEDDGAWVRSTQAQIIMFPTKPQEIGEIEISVSALVEEGHEDRLVTFHTSGGSEARRISAEGKRIMLPARPVEEQTITIECSNLGRPENVNGAIDSRRLCVKVYAIALRSKESG